MAETPEEISKGIDPAGITCNEFLAIRADVRMVVTDFPASGVVVRLEKGRIRSDSGAFEAGIRPEWFEEVEVHPKAPKIIKKEKTKKMPLENKYDLLKTTD